MKNKQPIQIEASMIGRHGGDENKKSRNRYNNTADPKSPRNTGINIAPKASTTGKQGLMNTDRTKSMQNSIAGDDSQTLQASQYMEKPSTRLGNGKQTPMMYNFDEEGQQIQDQSRNSISGKVQTGLPLVVPPLNLKDLDNDPKMLSKRLKSERRERKEQELRDRPLCNKPCWINCCKNFGCILYMLSIIGGGYMWIIYLKTSTMELRQEFQAHPDKHAKTQKIIYDLTFENHVLNQNYKRLKKSNKIMLETVQEYEIKIPQLKKTIDEATAHNKKQKTIYDEMQSFFKAYETNDDIQKFITSLNSEPGFGYYNPDSLGTQRLSKMWKDSNKCGGTIASSINSDKAKDIHTTNIAQSVKDKKEKVIGYYDIKKLLEKPVDDIKGTQNFAQLYDIQILLIAPQSWDDAQIEKATQAWKDLKSGADTTVKCCINDPKPEKSIDQYMYGYVRVMSYKVKQCCSEDMYTNYLYEGRIEGGIKKFNGFGRYINGDDNILSIGWYQDFQMLNGQFIYYQDNNLKKQGAQKNSGKVANNWTPTDEYVVTDLTSAFRTS